MVWSLRGIGKGSGGAFEEGRLCKEAFIGVSGGVFSEGEEIGEESGEGILGIVGHG